MKRGDIYLINCDLKIRKHFKKVRPALIIQSDETIKNTEFITVIPISSTFEKCKPNEMFVVKDKYNKLVKNSVLKLQQISSFRKERLIYKIGHIRDVYLSNLRNILWRHFGLPF